MDAVFTTKRVRASRSQCARGGRTAATTHKPWAEGAGCPASRRRQWTAANATRPDRRYQTGTSAAKSAFTPRHCRGDHLTDFAGTKTEARTLTRPRLPRWNRPRNEGVGGSSPPSALGLPSVPTRLLLDPARTFRLAGSARLPARRLPSQPFAEPCGPRSVEGPRSKTRWPPFRAVRQLGQLAGGVSSASDRRRETAATARSAIATRPNPHSVSRPRSGAERSPTPGWSGSMTAMQPLLAGGGPGLASGSGPPRRSHGSATGVPCGA